MELYIQPKDSRLRYTKQCIFDAFLKMLEAKPVSDMSVSEISEAAGVSRKTFYKYYSDGFNLLQAMQNELFALFLEQLGQLPANIYAMAPALIHFASEHHVLVRASFENRSMGNFIDRVIAHLHQAFISDWLAANPTLAAENVDYLFYYVVEGLTGIIRHWLIDEPETPEAEVIAKAAWLMLLTTPANNKEQ